jgi:hypothetical protein
MVVVIILMLVVVEEGDDGLGTFMAWSADAVSRKPVHGRQGAADAAIHDDDASSYSFSAAYSLYLPLQ